MNGLEATERIRRSFPPEEQPHIIAMTANAMENDRQRCLNCGMNDYMPKPFRLKQFIDKLMQFASGL